MNEKELIEIADRLAAALAIAIYDAHPVYSSTSGWVGGAGGQAFTQSCSMISPPPNDMWLESGFDLLSRPLREYMSYRSLDLNAKKKELESELRQSLGEKPAQKDNRPHSRACGIKKHEHGIDCHSNCPTCGGKNG